MGKFLDFYRVSDPSAEKVAPERSTRLISA